MQDWSTDVAATPSSACVMIHEPVEGLARGLAWAFLAAPLWTRTGLIASAGVTLRRQPRWLGRVAEPVLERYLVAPVDRPYELAAFVLRETPLVEYAERAARRGRALRVVDLPVVPGSMGRRRWPVPDQVVVPFVYTCGTKADPQGVQYDPAAFQTVYDDASAAAFTGDEDTPDYPTFTCDGTQHVSDVVLTGQEGGGFENGNIEVGLVKADDSTAEPTFEHVVIGYDQLHNTRAEVAVTVNATPESTKAGSKITVKGTVKRDGKAYKGKDATLYFQTKAGAPAAKIGSATADSKGNLSTKVTVTGPGTYFWTTTSTSKTQAGASLGDYAAAA